MNRGRAKAQQTMMQRYGVKYTLESAELKERVQSTTLMKYGVKNVQQSSEFKQSMYASIRQHQKEMIPIKIQKPDLAPPFMKLDDSSLHVYKLREEASREFLRRYGFNQHSKFGKFHVSFGLVQDSVLYQVIRFERHKDKVYLTDFGTREGFQVVHYYEKLIRFAKLFGVDSFITSIPRYIAQDVKLIYSLGIEFVEEQPYDVYWIMDSKIKKMVLWDKPEEMLSRYDYFTSDYKEIYRYN